jgi:beta-lactamase regulating signal transducer with metallopeptidase domain
MGWVLVHSLWIGVLVAGALSVAFGVLRRRASAVRYGMACGALVVLVAVPAQLAVELRGHWEGHNHYVWMIENGVRHEPGVGHVPDPNATVVPTAAAIQARHEASMPPWISGQQAVRVGMLLSLLAIAWLIGAGVRAVSAARAWGTVRRLRATAEPAPREWTRSLSRLASEMTIAVPVRLARSRLVQVPSLIGWRRPLVLLPSWLDEERPLAEIEAILAHELAHVRRHDFLVNAIQSISEIVLYYHPAYWWIAGRIREEREFCCDEVATVSVPGGAAAYLRSLLALEGLRPAAPMGQALALTDGDLVRRARRLTDRVASDPEVAWRRLDPAVFVLAGALLCLPLMGAEPAARHASGALMEQDLEMAVIHERGREGREPRGYEGPGSLSTLEYTEEGRP